MARPSSPDTSNSSGGSGIQLNVTSVPIFFVIMYGIMSLQYFRITLRNPTQVFISLSLFCVIRVSAFVMYVVTSDSKSLNSVNSTKDAFFGVGFFALLYSAYALVLDREFASGNVVKNSISRITSNRYLICSLLAVAVAIGTASFVCHSQRSMSAFPLRKTYTIIFLSVTVLMGVQTLFQLNAERGALKRSMPPTTSGKVYHMYIPCLVLVLLLIHEIYFIIAIDLYIHSEALWWSLFVVSELLVVLILAIPDVVPEKKKFNSRVHEQELDEDRGSP